MFSATSLCYLIVNRDISLIKISRPISFFYIAEYSTVWLSFNSSIFFLGQKTLVWAQGSASPGGILVQLCLDTQLLFLQEESPHTGLLGWWEHHSEFESIGSDVCQPCYTDPFFHQRLFSSVQSLSHIESCATPWIAARQASVSLTNSQSLPKLMSIESVMTSNHLILCHLLLLPPSIFPNIRVFSNESVLHIRWPKY